MKRKTLTMVLCLLTCLSLIGVGFAAWVISSGDTSDPISGNIQVDTVTDHRFTLSPASITDKIIFDMKSDASITDPWLANDDAAENLSVSFDITVSVKNALAENTEAAWANAVTIAAEYTAPDTPEYRDAVEAGAISEGVVSVAFSSASDDKKSATYTVTITFAWGEAFDTGRTTYYSGSALSLTNDDNTADNLNPYTFYNVKDGSTHKRPVENWGDDAYYYLDLIQKLGSTTTYNVTVSATPVNA